jgi:hypothetical protein
MIYSKSTHVKNVHPSNPERAVRLLGRGAHDDFFAVDHNNRVALTVSIHNPNLISRGRHCFWKLLSEQMGVILIRGQQKYCYNTRTSQQVGLLLGLSIVSSVISFVQELSPCNSDFSFFACLVGQFSLVLHTLRVVALPHGVKNAACT